MPIYAYKCGSCGYAKDVLQKISDAPLTQCPECSEATFSKQLTAAGFQLKGSGWYATDFKGGTGAASESTATADSAVASTAGDSASATQGSNNSANNANTASVAAAPAGGCAAGCACH